MCRQFGRALASLSDASGVEYAAMEKEHSDLLHRLFTAQEVAAELWLIGGAPDAYEGLGQSP